MQSNKNFILYGLGSVAFGIKNNAFGWFLLFYYNIVLGLPGWMASLAIAIALIIDAISDLLIGYAIILVQNLEDDIHICMLLFCLCL